MKKLSKYINYILILMMLAGFSLLLYPTVADYWNSFHQSTVIASYVEAISKLRDEYDEILTKARDYNERLAAQDQLRRPTEEQMQEYYSLLDVTGTGVMGYVTIPSIDVNLPIYHTTGEQYLALGAGHLEWTSLPVGGISTHCVISGHRGLPSARLFTDLDKLKEGETFTLSILDETLTYEVDRILIIEPGKTDDLAIVPGLDYCTLLTCTPYGINSHRLLVRGHRVENRNADQIRVSADGTFIEPLIVAPIAAVPMMIVLMIGIFMPKKIITGKERKHEEQ